MGWLPRQWVIGSAFTVAAVCCLFLARDASNEMTYWAALALSGFCVLAVFAAISDAFEPLPIARLKTMPESGMGCYATGAIVGALGIFGLVKAGGAGAIGDEFVYYEGLGLFVVAVAYDFLLIKDWFDRSQTDAPDYRPGPS